VFTQRDRARQRAAEEPEQVVGYMAQAEPEQALQCADQHQQQTDVLCFGALAESVERKIAEQMKSGSGHPHARTNTPFGVKALQGQRPNMEDAYSVQMTPPPSSSAGPGAAEAPSTPPQEPPNGPAPEASAAQSDDTIPPAPTLSEDHNLAVLSVFDGHGGNEVAEHCRESLHRHFAYQLSLQRATDDDSSSGNDDSSSQQQQQQQQYSHHHIAEALRASFLCTDHELKGTEAGDYVGATAVVAVVGKTHIIIGHAGAGLDCSPGDGCWQGGKPCVC